jgi:hypothetical protein
MIVAREGLEDFFAVQRFNADTEGSVPAKRFHGRARLRSIALPDGTPALVRSYRRGGMVRYLTSDLFCTWPPRPFAELAVTEVARARKIFTLEVVAACIERSWGPIYRGWLVTRELTTAKNLWETLQERRYAVMEKRTLLKTVAESVRWMHVQGVYHSDLNVRNLLVSKEGCRIEVYIIDFDKARLYTGALSGEKVEENLERLHRSLRKADPGQKWFSQEEWDWFRSCYREAHFADI